MNNPDRGRPGHYTCSVDQLDARLTGLAAAPAPKPHHVGRGAAQMRIGGTSRAVLLLSAAVSSACDPPVGDRSFDPPTYGVANSKASSCQKPAPRWVLRDRDGVAVRALVEPRCGFGNAAANTECLAIDFGSSRSFPCVRVIDHEDRYVNVLYELTSGQIEPCYPVDGVKYGMIFLNSECSGTRYDFVGVTVFDGDPEFMHAQMLAEIDGTLWVQSGSDCVSMAPGVWQSWGGTCSLLYEPLKDTICPYRELEDWVTDLLPNPPYSLGVEYE